MTFAREGEFAIAVHLLNCFANIFFLSEETVYLVCQTPALHSGKSLLSGGVWTLSCSGMQELCARAWDWGHAAQALPWKAAWHAVCFSAWQPGVSWLISMCWSTGSTV